MTGHDNAAAPPGELAPPAAEDFTITCADGYQLTARVFVPAPGKDTGRTAVIATATGAKASYYWRYAAFLAEAGVKAVVADYRGVGRSAPAGAPKALRGMRVRWHDWGMLDVDALIGWAVEDGPDREIVAVGHSFGGLAICLASRAAMVSRVLMVGTQHGYWRDYARNERAKMLWRWHLVMPAVATVLGYFPGRRLGWLEDLPRGVALDWARSRRRFNRTMGAAGKAAFARMKELDFEVLAVAPTDDPFATRVAMDRTLAYLPKARIRQRFIDPADEGVAEIGHLRLFHDSFRTGPWTRSLRWLLATEPEGVGVLLGTPHDRAGKAGGRGPYTAAHPAGKPGQGPEQDPAD